MKKYIKATLALITAVCLLITVLLINGVTAESGAKPAAGAKIICFGDSITQRGSPSYSAQLMSSLGSYTTVYNEGHGGWNTAMALNNTETALKGYIGQDVFEYKVLAPKPDFVTIMFGTNDSQRTGSTVSQVSLADFELNIKTMAERIKSNGSIPILMTPPPVDDSGAAALHPGSLYPDYNNSYNQCQSAYAQKVRDAAAAEGIGYVDIYNTLSADISKYMSSDGIHPSQDGYNLIASTLYDYLAANYPGGPNLPVYTEGSSITIPVADFESYDTVMAFAHWGTGPQTVFEASGESVNTATGSKCSLKDSFTPSGTGTAQIHTTVPAVINNIKKAYASVDAGGFSWWMNFAAGDNTKFKAGIQFFSSYTIPGLGNNFGIQNTKAPDSNGYIIYSIDELALYTGGAWHKFSEASKADRDLFFANLTTVNLLYNVTSGIDTTVYMDDISLYGTGLGGNETTAAGTSEETQTTASTVTTVPTETTTVTQTTVTSETVTVTSAIPEQFPFPYQTRSGLLYGLRPNGQGVVTVDSFMSPLWLEENEEVKILGPDDTQVTEGNIATNMRAVYYRDGALISGYTIVYYGDVDCDGKISSSDLLAVKRLLLHINSMSPVYSEAADVTHDGKIDASDLLVFKKHLLRITDIKQTYWP